MYYSVPPEHCDAPALPGQSRGAAGPWAMVCSAALGFLVVYLAMGLAFHTPGAQAPSAQYVSPAVHRPPLQWRPSPLVPGPAARPQRVWARVATAEGVVGAEVCRTCIGDVEGRRGATFNLHTAVFFSPQS